MMQSMKCYAPCYPKVSGNSASRAAKSNAFSQNLRTVVPGVQAIAFDFAGSVSTRCPLLILRCTRLYAHGSNGLLSLRFCSGTHHYPPTRGLCGVRY
eukprot:1510988-Rhodomonas_salina.1